MALLCKNCAGTLTFDPQKQMLVCSACNSSFRPEDIEDPDKELLTRTGKLRDARMYICNHCGAEVELNESEASSFCLFCGNPAIVFKGIEKTKCPDLIIPFKIPREEVQTKLEQLLKKSLRLNKKQKKFEVEKIRGIYIPYWKVSAKLYDSYEVQTDIGSDDHTHYVYTSISGTMDLDPLPVYGSDMLPEVTLGQMDYWDFDEAVQFDEEYLAGFYADKADTSYADIKDKTAKRGDALFKEKTASRAKGSKRHYTAAAPVVDITKTPEYVLVPVWFITLDNHDGTRSTFMVNGQTGQSVGTFPVKIGGLFSGTLKKALLGTLITLVLAVIASIFYGDYVIPFCVALLSVDLMAVPILFFGSLIPLFIAIQSNRINNDESRTTAYSSKRKEA